MPKSVEVLVYPFNELSDKAKDKAHYDHLSSGFEYAWSSESGDTIRSFCDLFNVDLKDSEVCSYRYGYTVEIPQQRGITKRKALSMVQDWANKDGYWLSSIACESIKSGWYHGDIKYSIRNCLDDMFKAYQDDLEHQESIEYFSELCDCNEWQFLENGEMFHE